MCYSTFLNLENIIATPNQFFFLKNYPNYYYYINSFSLLRIFFSLILSVSHIIQTQNTKQNPILKIKLNQNKQLRKKEKKKKKRKKEITSQSDPAWWWGGRQAVVGWKTSGGGKAEGMAAQRAERKARRNGAI